MGFESLGELARAHALVDEGVFFRTNQLGRTIVHGSGEGQYWWPLAKPAAAGG